MRLSMAIFCILLFFLPLSAQAKQIIPCIKKENRFWKTTKEQCLQLTTQEADAYRAALLQLKTYKNAMDAFLQQTLPLLKKAQEEVKNLKDRCKKREKLLNKALKISEERAALWKEAFIKLKKKKEAPIPFYKHPAFVFISGAILGGTISALITYVIVSTKK